MDILLTSFGIGMQGDNEDSPFYRMPPLISSGTDIGVDSAAFLMFDRVIIDSTTYDYLLNRGPNILLRGIIDRERGPEESKLEDCIKEYAQFLQDLESSGRLVVRDFEATLRQKDNREILTKSVKNDLRNMEEWIVPLEESLASWTRLMDDIMDSYYNPTPEGNQRAEAVLAHTLRGSQQQVEMRVHTLKRWRQKLDQNERNYARGFMNDYLSYISSNILLSNIYDSAFIDWDDMQPFYHKKAVLSARQHHPGQSIIEESRKLFSIIFPHFMPTDLKKIAKAMDDKRIDELRGMVQKAVKGEIEFDPEFAVQTLQEVIKAQKKTMWRREITGWITSIFGLIPVAGTGAGKAAEEIGNTLWSDRPQKKFGWFYLINKLDASQSQKGMEKEVNEDDR